MRCWRFQGRKGALELVPCFVTSFGSGYGREDPRLRGNAELAPTHVGPFCAVIENEADPGGELNALIGKAAQVTPEIVRQVLGSGRFTFYDVGDGFAILNYPHFVNGFLDRFFLDLLAAA